MSITKVLVANRGEIARRIFRTCREMDIGTVAVYSDPDASEPHVLEADEAVLLPGEDPKSTYLNIDAILDAAAETGADAIHPGYGFLSENPLFPMAVIYSGRTWIGPPSRAIEVMGSKIESKEVAAAAGVPIVPSVALRGLSAIASAAISLGFPVLVKASAGGGGKGMRVVHSSDGLMDAIEGAKREAAKAFGDDTVFLEKYLDSPRHIEIQIMADTHGSVVALFERECSIQRRHQKIIEEAPSVGIDDLARARIAESAVAAAKAVEYTGAGTVEFLYHEGRHYFLEMNTRLQVEHPVTEMVTGLDLVRLQIEVADGLPLPDKVKNAEISGHAIEARIYAEDPLNDFLPVTGPIHHFEFSDIDGLRVDAGVSSGSQVSVHYDPMLAKVIAHAPNRTNAAETLARALRSARIHSGTTNRALLVHILEDEQFLAGDTDTSFLDRRDLSELAAPLLDETEERVAAIAAALADRAHRQATAGVLRSVPAGWRNSPNQMQTVTYTGIAGTHTINYALTRKGLKIEGVRSIKLIEVDGGIARFGIGRGKHDFTVSRYGNVRHVDSEKGSTRLVLLPRFADTLREEESGSLHAPMPGRVLRVDVSVGDRVTDGQVLMVLEAMKMEHTIRAPHQGVIASVNCQVEDQVQADEILVVVKEDA